MLNEKQINHIKRYYKIFNSKTSDLKKLIIKINKINNNIENNQTNVDYFYVIYGNKNINYDYDYNQDIDYDRIKKNIDDKMYELKELEKTLDLYRLCKTELSYLNEEFYKYLIDNNIDYNDRSIDENDYNIIHDINF